MKSSDSAFDRLGAQVQERLKRSLPSLVANCIASEPSVQPALKSVSEAAALNSLTGLKSQLLAEQRETLAVMREECRSIRRATNRRILRESVALVRKWERMGVIPWWLLRWVLGSLLLVILVTGSLLWVAQVKAWPYSALITLTERVASLETKKQELAKQLEAQRRQLGILERLTLGRDSNGAIYAKVPVGQLPQLLQQNGRETGPWILLSTAKP